MDKRLIQHVFFFWETKFYFYKILSEHCVPSKKEYVISIEERHLCHNIYVFISFGNTRF